MKEDTLLWAELAAYGLDPSEYTPIREKDGVIVGRVRRRGEQCVIKCFENEAFRREIGNYAILEKCGVPTLKLYAHTDKSILMEDLEASDEWRLGREEDLSDPLAAKALARWYRALHEGGAAHVRDHGEGMYDEWDGFSPAALEEIGRLPGMEDSRGLRCLMERFDDIAAKMAAAPRTLCYNDFYYTNLAVRRDGAAALMFDYNLLGKGCAACDLRNAAYWYSLENRRLFLSEYGTTDEGLFLLDEIVSPALTLISAAKRSVFPRWGEEAKRALERDVPEKVGQLLNLGFSY